MSIYKHATPPAQLALKSQLNVYKMPIGVCGNSVANVRRMDVSYVTAFAALGGAALGGFTSFATQWTITRSARNATNKSNSRARRRQIYKQFIEESSKMYGDALIHNVMDLPGLVGLYSLISMMRVISSQPVIDHAVRVTQEIAAIYNQPNRTAAELGAMIETDAVDLLRSFSDACRLELEASYRS